MGHSNIFLVGMMGAGKTTVGRALAHRLKREFVDTDRLLVERTGVAVATVFEIEGEDGFRRRESALLRELCEGEGSVVATGGGIVLSGENRDAMRESGTVVYLRARLESLWERTRHDTSRPLLATPNPREKLAELLREREPLYRAAAHIVVDSGSQSAGTLASRVAAALRAREAGTASPP
jgi:shikimate kinase